MTEEADGGADPGGSAAPRREAPPSLPPPLSKAAQAFADKARDLDALRTTVVDAAGVGAGLWFSYLFVLLYLFIAVGSVTHKDLFLQSPIRLPFLNIELPLLGFFALGPLLFLVVHGYVLLHLVLLAGKVGAFHAELKQLDTPPETHEDLRRQLPSNLFVQILAGPREVRGGSVGFLLRLVAQFSLVFGPVALLAFFLLQFLPYHHEWITGWHRIALVLDLALLWLLWPSVAGGRVVRLRELWSLTTVVMTVATLFVAVSAFTVATFPGERLHTWRSLLQVPTGRDDKGEWAWASLHAWLIDGEVDEYARAPKSLWSNRLVLPGLDLIDRAKFDMPSKLAELPETISLRKRDLRGAVLTGAVLDRADLTAAQLQGASLNNAHLKGASLIEARLQGALLFGVQLQGASLQQAHLQGVTLSRAQLQAALLDEAQLQGALLFGAQLQGASLQQAKLQGASLEEAHLEGASLIGAELQGASLAEAHLQGALLVIAQLQGAYLDEAQLQGAALDGTAIWRSDPRNAGIGPTRIVKMDRRPLSSKDFEEIKRSIVEKVPNGRQKRRALQQIKDLDPSVKLSSQEVMEKAWAELEASSLSPDVFMASLAEKWQRIGCDTIGSPYVLRRLIEKLKDGSASIIFRTHSEDEIALRNKHLTTLAADFLKDNCAGATGLTNEEKAVLRSLAWEKAGLPH